MGSISGHHTLAQIVVAIGAVEWRYVFQAIPAEVFAKRQGDADAVFYEIDDAFDDVGHRLQRNTTRGFQFEIACRLVAQFDSLLDTATTLDEFGVLR